MKSNSGMREGDLVKIQWLYSVNHSGRGEFVDEGMDCESVGFFFKETEEYVAIYQSHLFGLDGVIVSRADYLQISKLIIKNIITLVESDE